jgi:hypothetical protein
MRLTGKLISVVAAATIGLTSQAAAQAELLQPGSTIRIGTGGRFSILRYAGADSQGVRATERDGRLVIYPRSDSLSVHVRTGGGVMRGAKRGAMIGGLTGVAVVAAVALPKCRNNCGESAAFASVIFGGTGAAIGAITGGIVGEALKRWTPVNLEPAIAIRR